MKNWVVGFGDWSSVNNVELTMDMDASIIFVRLGPGVRGVDSDAFFVMASCFVWFTFLFNFQF